MKLKKIFIKNYIRTKYLVWGGCIFSLINISFLSAITTKDVISFKEVFSINSTNKIIDTYIQANIKKGWILYSIKKLKKQGPVPTQFSFDKNLKITSIKESTPKIKKDKNFMMDVYYHKKQTFFLIQSKLKNQSNSTLKNTFLKIRFMVCNDKICLPPTNMFVKIYPKDKILKSSDMVFFEQAKFEVNEYQVINKKDRKNILFPIYTSAKKKVLTTQVHVAILPSWKLYSVQDISDSVYKTQFFFQDKSLKIISLLEGKSKSYYDENLKSNIYYFNDKARFYFTVKMKKKDKEKYTVNAKYMVCNDNLCLPPSKSIFLIKK